MEGGREEEGFCEGKSGESVRCLLNITKYGLYPTSILAPPWGLVPFLLPFLLSLLFLVIDLYFCTIIFFLCFFLLFYRICYILQISSSSSILDPPSVTLGTDLGVATRQRSKSASHTITSLPQDRLISVRSKYVQHILYVCFERRSLPNPLDYAV